MKKIDLSSFKVADSGTAREINRRIILNLIRTCQPVSRAELARRSGLQRSTVSSIVDELIQEKWVIEGALGDVPRGRKPTMLYLNGERAGVIGINIQPTRTNIVVSTLDLHFILTESIPTGKEPQQFLDFLANRVVEIVRAHSEITYEGIGVSVPGRIDLTTKKLVFAPNLSWMGVDIRTPLEKTTGLPVEIDNAANACALAELWSNERKEQVKNILAVTVSEGIGVGMVLNAQLVKGARGLAGEFGHFTMDPNGPLCNCGNNGCWETLASNTACLRFYAQSKAQHLPSKPLSTITYDDIIKLALQNDARAVEAVQKQAYYLGLGLSMLVVGFDPEVILIVGPITRVWSLVDPIVTKTIETRVRTGAKPKIIPTDPDTQPRLVGTVAMVLAKHFGAPQLF